VPDRVLNHVCRELSEKRCVPHGWSGGKAGVNVDSLRFGLVGTFVDRVADDPGEIDRLRVGHDAVGVGESE
jgi:hypothetical protein